jgi:uncharacterized membrane protein
MSEILVHFGLLFALPALALAVVGLEGVRPYRRLGLVAAAATVAGYGFGMATLALFLRAGVLDLRHLWSLVLPLEAFLVLTIGLSLLRFYPHLPETRAYVVLVGVAGGALAAWRPVAGSLLIVALVAGTWLLANWRRAAAPVVALAVLGVGIIAASDLFVVVDDLYGSPWERMNTVFKLFNEAWPLLAISGWIAVLWGWSRRPPIASARAVATPLLVFTALAASLYLLLGTPQRLALRWPSTPSPGSLDGYAWMNGGRYLNSAGENIETTDDYRVIQWLRTHVTGNPVVLEASIGPYRGNGSRISSATGLPTVLGWDRHERQQRTVVIPIDSSVRLVSPLGDAVDQRLLDVRQLYDTTDVATKRELLARYRVRYVVVGQVERSWLLPAGFAAATRTNEPYASPEGLAAFTALEGSTLHRVATFGSTVIYEVRLTDVEQRG